MPFMKPVRVMTPMSTSRAAPTFTVLAHHLLVALEEVQRTVPVNRPTARKGTTKPTVYTPMSRKPLAALPEEEAISSTLPRVGPHRASRQS